MSEGVEQIPLRVLQLNELHAGLGGDLIERDGWLLPASYGDVLREYAAVRERGAGLVDLSNRGRIKVSGSEAIQFLNGLITNDVSTLDQNHWLPAVFPNVQGRLIASVRIIRCPDEETEKGSVPVFLLDTEAPTHERVLKTLERFMLAGDFHVTDLTSSTVLLSLHGKQSSLILSRIFGIDVTEMPANGARPLNWNNATVQLVRAYHTAADGFDLVIYSDQAAELWETLRQHRAWPVGLEAWEILRVEAGIARYGADIDENLVVSETNLDDSVSFTKGCYIGQEIIARIKYRGHVAKKLTGLMFERSTKVDAGATVQSTDGKDIGRLTSVTYSPHLGRTIALALIKYDYLTPGTEVKVDGAVPGLITELPFVK